MAGKDAKLMSAEGLDYLGFREEVIKARYSISQFVFSISFPYNKIIYCFKKEKEKKGEGNEREGKRREGKKKKRTSLDAQKTLLLGKV